MEHKETSIFCIEKNTTIAIAHVPTHLANFWHQKIREIFGYPEEAFFIKINIIPYTRDIIYIYQEQSYPWSVTKEFHPIKELHPEQIERYQSYIEITKTNKNYRSTSKWTTTSYHGNLIKIKKNEIIEIKTTRNIKIETSIYVHQNPFEWMNEIMPEIPTPPFYWYQI